MLCKSISTIFLVFFCSTAIKAQICVPNAIDNIELSENYTLSWSPSENCENTQYLVTIETSSVVEYEYTIDTLNLDVSFLSICRTYTFTVTPVADHVLGGERKHDATVTLPDDVDISIKNFTGSPIGDDVLIQWIIDEEYKYCVGYFNLRTWNEDSETPESVYLGQNGYLLEHVAHCMNYRFEITIFYDNRNLSTAKFNYTVPEATNPPSLVDLSIAATTINTTWSLEKYHLNRCPLTALYLNGTYVNATYPIEDSPERPDVHVSINGLKADMMYYFNVSTENSAGISKVFQIAIQTLAIGSSSW